MSTKWLYEQLQGGHGVVVDAGDPILSVTFGDRSERVYCPNPSEYLVTADLVDKARSLGATIIAYSNSWGESTYEAKQHAKNNSIVVMPYGGFFAYLKKHGVTLKK